jgi:stage III sporulation protein SpoIIIAA
MAHNDAGLNALVNLLPTKYIGLVEQGLDATSNLIDIQVDLGRVIKLRFADGFILVPDTLISKSDIHHILSKLDGFDRFNRQGVPNTLHRVSRILNTRDEVVGLTLRYARELEGLEAPLIPYLNGSILIIGVPGQGKTSYLRCLANYVSGELCRETIVVDKTNEIAGYSDVPHPIIGLARRMQVKEKQAFTMLEAVENHTPHTIIVDEIRDREEAYAAKTVAERGVQLIATCHGVSLASVLKNPTLQPIMGGINVVTLGDDEARHRGTSKTVTERETVPTFDTIIELIAHDEIAIHTNAERAIDALLAGRQVQPLVLRKLGDTWREIMPEKIALPEPLFNTPATIGDMIQVKKKKG